MGIFKHKFLTARVANYISRFGCYKKWDDLVENKIKDIEDQIKNKLNFSRRDKIICLLVPDDQADLYEEVRIHFESNAFKTFYADNSNLKELGDNRYLFISWDI